MRRLIIAIGFLIALAIAGCGTPPTPRPPTLTPTLPRPTSTPIPTPTATPVILDLKRLVAVAFVNADIGWVAGGACDGSPAGSCLILATGDGGKNWTEQYRTGVTLEELVFVDATHGWALGRSTGGCSGPTLACPSVLLITTDGKTWTQREIEKSGWSNLQFLDPNVGWAVATSCTISGAGTRCSASLRRTSDGGVNWSPVPIPGLVPTGISFVDATHGWAVGWGCKETGGTAGCPALIMVTRDGGKTWFRQLQAEETFGTVAPQVTFINLQNGWWLSGGSSACTGGGCWPSLYRTTDGGRLYTRIQRPNQWKISGTDARSGFPKQMHFVNASIGWISVSAGTGTGGIATTRDSGASWTRSGGGEGWDISGISATSAQELWIVGSGRVTGGTRALLLHSADGGQTWMKVLPQ